MPSNLIPTKIPLLDEMLGGGLEPGTAVAYWSEVEVDVSALALQTAYNRTLSGERMLFVSMTKRPNQVVESMKELGLDPAPDTISFIDFSPTPVKIHGKSDRLLIALQSRATTDLFQKISEWFQSPSQTTMQAGADFQDSHHPLVLFDSFSTFLDRLEENNCQDEAIAFLERTKELLAKRGAIGLFVFTAWPYGKELLDKVRNCFHTVVDLKATPEKPIYSMAVSRSAPQESPKSLAFFKVAKPGGVKIYLPKIIVTGPFHAGKSSFVHSASRGAVSADRLGTTVAIDYGHVEHKGFVIDLFGTPGQTRFDNILEKLGGSSVGVILLVSATDNRSFARAKEQARMVKAEHLPYVVAVNKANLRGAISLVAVRNLMRIPTKVPVIPLRAADLSQVRPGLPCKLNMNDIDRVLDAIVGEIMKSETVRLAA